MGRPNRRVPSEAAHPRPGIGAQLVMRHASNRSAFWKIAARFGPVGDG